MATSDAQSIDIRKYLNVLRRRRLLVAAVALGAGLVALLVSLTRTPIYEAKADVLVQPRATESVFQDNQTRSALNTLETEIEVISSDPVRRGVEARLGWIPSVSASRVGETDVMRLAGRSTSARRAAQIANAYAESYVQFRKEEAVSDLEAAGRGLREKINSLQTEIDGIERRIAGAGATERSSLEANLRPRHSNLLEQQGQLAQKLDQLEVDAALKSGGARIVKAANTPGSPAEPKPIREALAASLAGLIIGAVLAFVRENLDDSVRTKDELAAASGLPVLGVVPSVRRWNRGVEIRAGLKEPESAAGEAFRSLRTSVQLLGVDRPLCIIQITSPIAGEGKTTMVSGLGTVLAAGGQRVVLVDGDLRRPRLHEAFGLMNDRGLTSAFSGDGSVIDAVRQVPGEDRLFVLSSGPMPSNPAEMLSSPRMAELLFELQGKFDVVLVDSAPVLPVTDATLLAAWVEATLLVARARTTTQLQLAEAVEQLHRVDANVAGVVLNDASDQANYGYYYTGNGIKDGARKVRRPSPAESRLGEASP